MNKGLFFIGAPSVKLNKKCNNTFFYLPHFECKMLTFIYYFIFNFYCYNIYITVVEFCSILQNVNVKR